MLEDDYDKYGIYEEIPPDTKLMEKCYKDLEELLDPETYSKVERILMGFDNECVKLGYIQGFKKGVSLAAECFYKE